MTVAPSQLLWRLSGLGRQHQLLRGAALLALNAGLQAAFGFVFGVICTHTFTAADVGKATTLLSAASVLSYVSDLGLNNTLLRTLPTSEDPDAEINSAMLITIVFSLYLALAYVEIASRISAPLAFMGTDLLRTLAFVGITAALSANLLTDAVFVARRHAELAVVTDSFVQGSVRVAGSVALAGAGAFGMFVASGFGAVVAVTASFVLLFFRLGVRPAWRINLSALRSSIRFSLASYVGNVLQILPNVALPLIVINRLGASSAAYFAVAYNLASLIYTVCYSLGNSLLAEGSQRASDIAALFRQAKRILIPANIVLMALALIGGREVLLLYGSHYRSQGSAVFFVLVAGLPAVALNNIMLILLKLRGRLGAIIWASMLSAGLTILIALEAGRNGTVWVGFGFVIGQLAAALFASAVWRDARP